MPQSALGMLFAAVVLVGSLRHFNAVCRLRLHAAAPCCADAVKGAPSKDLKAWRDSPRLALLNLKYDAMPAGQLLVCVSVCAVWVAEVGLPAVRQAGKQPQYLAMTGFDFWK